MGDVAQVGWARGSNSNEFGAKSTLEGVADSLPGGQASYVEMIQLLQGEGIAAAMERVGADSGDIVEALQELGLTMAGLDHDEAGFEEEITRGDSQLKARCVVAGIKYGMIVKWFAFFCCSRRSGLSRQSRLVTLLFGDTARPGTRDAPRQPNCLRLEALLLHPVGADVPAQNDAKHRGSTGSKARDNRHYAAPRPPFGNVSCRLAEHPVSFVDQLAKVCARFLGEDPPHTG